MKREKYFMWAVLIFLLGVFLLSRSSLLLEVIGMVCVGTSFILLIGGLMTEKVRKYQNHKLNNSEL